MASVLILGNFKLSFEHPEGAPAATPASVRAKERKILRLLKKLVEDEPGVKGTVEGLEFEGFTYDEPHQATPTDYYYNKYSADETAKPGEL